jgi:hypothetical protein
MFTIKWVTSNCEEMLYRGTGISFTPGDDTRKATVSFEVGGGSRCIIDTGTIYVMNDNGRTVANYILSSKEWPHGVMPRNAA